MTRFTPLIENILEAKIIEGAEGAESSFLVSLLSKSLGRPLLWILEDNNACEKARRELTTFLASPETEESILFFPENESSYYQGISPHPSTSVKRALSLWRIHQGFSGIVLTTVKSMLTLLPHPERLFRHSIKLETGETLDPNRLIQTLRILGYTRADSVTEEGTFSVRGGIIDVFSISQEHPLRIDFFGNEIDSIREFNPSTQRSIKMLPGCAIIPVREIIVSDQDTEKWNRKSFEIWSEIKYADDLEEKFAFTSHRELFNGFEFLFPVLHQDQVGILNYFQKAPYLVFTEPEKSLEMGLSILKEAAEEYESCREEGLLALPPEKLMHSGSTWKKLVADADLRLNLLSSRKKAHLFRLSSQPERVYNSNFKDLLDDYTQARSRGEIMIFILPTPGLAERLSDIASEYEIILPRMPEGFPSALDQGSGIIQGWIRSGFYFPEEKLHVLTETEIFGQEKTRGTSREDAASRHTIERFLPDFRDMEPGSPVVHVEHGIGIFQGLRKLGIGDDSNEFVVLNYLGDDKLYVPVDRLDLLQKYSGGGTAPPRIDRLGGTSWERTKQKVKKSIQDMAEGLIQLYARRELAGGFSHLPDDALTAEFEDAFPFQLTPDQASAIAAVKKDMEAREPMDRLVCGDVGYGKTEVAMRAAFKAVNSGKQVVLLAPTTVLAFQHLQTFRQRFSGFPVNIDMLSRFVPRSSQKEIIQQVELGMVDILIGTHRLLSKDITFNDLGLIIIDEEQRFGVAHKEKLKKLKVQVDVLALSATPIPRTLNMSLVGIRDLSIIETPPKDRLSIYTMVTTFSERLIRNAIELEIRRKGQVFFVHNEVKTIYSLAMKIQSFLPEARVCVAHGQMKEKMLEEIMIDFLEHHYDVMVCTTIIENGIDIARANTMIVNHAHNFGLSQLYQLRGRIGRSDRKAYAYLLAPKRDNLSREAQKRLAAIRDFSDLGSGFRLAAMDLEIRGAGNLLGGQQSGHIAAIGFDLYTRMLREAVSSLNNEEYLEDFRTSVDLKLDIHIPEHYIDDSRTRLWIYKRISSASTQQELDSIKEELVDRFGQYPKTVTTLFEYATIRIEARRLGVTSVEKKGRILNLAFHKDTPVKAETIISLAQKNNRMSISKKMAVSYELRETGESEMFLEIKGIMRGLSG